MFPSSLAFLRLLKLTTTWWRINNKQTNDHYTFWISVQTFNLVIHQIDFILFKGKQFTKDKKARCPSNLLLNETKMMQFLTQLSPTITPMTTLRWNFSTCAWQGSWLISFNSTQSFLCIKGPLHCIPLHWSWGWCYVTVMENSVAEPSISTVGRLLISSSICPFAEMWLPKYLKVFTFFNWLPSICSSLWSCCAVGKYSMSSVLLTLILRPSFW